MLEAVVGDVADLEAANTDRLSRPPHLRGNAVQINIVRRERSAPRDSQPKSGRRKIRRNLSPDVAT